MSTLPVSASASLGSCSLWATVHPGMRDGWDNLWNPVRADSGAHSNFDNQAHSFSAQHWSDTHRGLLALLGARLADSALGLAGTISRRFGGRIAAGKESIRYDIGSLPVSCRLLRTEAGYPCWTAVSRVIAAITPRPLLERGLPHAGGCLAFTAGTAPAPTQIRGYCFRPTAHLPEGLDGPYTMRWLYPSR